MRETELSACVRHALEEYFKDLDGQAPHAVYDMLIHCIEKPLLESVMHRAGGNQSKAAEILGLNRNTLRKKLKLHNIP
jgi:Fis family transcriptional regulator